MANKDYKEIQNLADSELVEKLNASRLELLQTRFDQTIKGQVSPNEIRQNKKQSARILTEMRAREISALSEAEIAKRSKIRNRRRKN